MGAVAGPQRGDALVLSLSRQEIQVELAAGGPAVPGVDVKISDDPHFFPSIFLSHQGHVTKSRSPPTQEQRPSDAGDRAGRLNRLAVALA